MQVPTDVAVVMAVLQEDRKERIDVPVPLSTFSDDVATIHGVLPGWQRLHLSMCTCRYKL